MLNQERLNSLLEAYIRDFDLWWQQEEYKLLSLQSFQSHWNLNCPDGSTKNPGVNVLMVK